MTSNAIVAGSVAAMSARTGKPLAETLLDVETVVIVDCSGSMDLSDSRGGRRRIDVAREELATLQVSYPGKLALVCFSEHAQMIFGGVPPEPIGSTNLAAGLKLAQEFDETGVRFVVVSDGLPDSETEALDVAARFHDPISTVYTGPESGYEVEHARAFLSRLAAAGRGEATTAERVDGLARAMGPLLLTA